MSDEGWQNNSKKGYKGKNTNQRTNQEQTNRQPQQNQNNQNQQQPRNNQQQQQQQQQQQNRNNQQQQQYHQQQNRNDQYHQQQPRNNQQQQQQQQQQQNRNNQQQQQYHQQQNRNDQYHQQQQQRNNQAPQASNNKQQYQQQQQQRPSTASAVPSNNAWNENKKPAWGSVKPINEASNVEVQRPVSAIFSQNDSMKSNEAKPTPPVAVKTAWGVPTSQATNQPEPQPVSQTVSQPVAQPDKPNIQTENEIKKPEKEEIIKENKEMKSEIRTADEPQMQLSTISADLNGFPKKPKERCTLGDNISLFANHFGLYLKSPIHLFQYDVSICAISLDKKTNVKKEREVKTREIAKQVFLELIKKYPNFDGKLVFDNKKIMFSMLELPINAENKCLEVNMLIDNSNNKEFVVRIKKSGEVDVVPNQQIDQVAMQALQLMVTHNLNHRFVPVMRSYFSTTFERTNLGFNIDLWKGFYVSVRPSELGFNLNIDVANTVFFNDDYVLNLAGIWYGCNVNDLGKCVNDGFESFIIELKGKKVKTHLNYSKKIFDLGPIASKHIINVKGQNITIEKYFSQQGIQLKYPHLPCLDLGKENYTPMELCRTELTSQRKVTPKQTSEIIRATAKPAHDRKQAIEKMYSDSKLNVDPILKNYNITMEMKMTQINGKVLPAPDLEYGNSMKLLSKDIGRKGQWDNLNKKFCETKMIDKWVVINFANRTDDRTLGDLVYSFQKVGATHGIQFSEPLDYLYGQSNMNETRTLEFLNKNLQKFPSIQLILAIVSGSTAIYNAIKTFGDVDKGISTQILDENTIYRQKGKYDRLVSNVCMKINVKLGGKNFKLYRTNPFFQTYLQNLYNGPLMIFGADVIHPSPLDKDTCESISAVVGSIDKDCCYYAARLQAQQQPKGKSLELIYDLRLMVAELLEEYFKANGTHPKRIVFLRDGVSEGQFKQVRNHEMNEIREACFMREKGYKPGITFVVVQKRHHTRFFPQNRADEAGRNANVPPGTLVDSKIITPDMFDFFLCSHMGIQGTSKPCHYFILHDDNDFSMNQIAILCHYLCHIYARSTTSVSYPAPTYYADLCAERGRGYIRKRIDESQARIISQMIKIHPVFKNRMFFI